MERDEVLSAFYHFTHGILIIIFIFIFCNIVFFFLLFLHFFGKKYYFLFFTLGIFITLYLTYLHHSFCFYLQFFVIYIFSFKKIIFFTFFSLKNYYIKIKEIVFNCNNCNIVLFSITLKLV
jgi:hypothetical protein